MNEIVTLARSSSSSVRSHGFPVLETGNLAFPDGRYIVDFRPGDDRSSFILMHRVEGAPLIPHLLDEDRARYVCAVSSPISSYRSTHVSSDPSHEIRWNEDDFGESPLFTPMIVSMASCDLRLDRDRDGVHEIWHGSRVRLVKGNRLAIGRVVQLKSFTLRHLLRFYPNNELKEGTFSIAEETENGFRFRVNLNPKLHAFLKHAGRGEARSNIITHIVTACLSFLQRVYGNDSDGDEGWKSHRNLLEFSKFLSSRSLPLWDDPEFLPELVATSLHPHILPQEQDREDET